MKTKRFYLRLEEIYFEGKTIELLTRISKEPKFIPYVEFYTNESTIEGIMADVCKFCWMNNIATPSLPKLMNLVCFNFEYNEEE